MSDGPTGDVVPPPVGVMRSVVWLDRTDGDVEVSGRLWIDLPDNIEFENAVVFYTLDRHRLLGMLAAARAGETDEAIFLALDAAALEHPDDEDDLPHDV